MGKKMNLFELILVLIVDLCFALMWYIALFISELKMEQPWGVILGLILTLYTLFVLFMNYKVFDKVIKD